MTQGTTHAVEAARRAFRAFGRAVRAERLYSANNAALVRIHEELARQFEELLDDGVLSVTIRADGFYLGDHNVLPEPQAEDSIPFAFYRDGMRRLDFAPGLGRVELEALSNAVAQGLGSGFVEDIVASLWRHELEHVHYVVVDTTIVAAEEGVRGEGGPVADVEVDAILRTLYGHASGDEVSFSVHLDRGDVPAKAIAEALDSMDELAPGLHPIRGFTLEPVYAAVLLEELNADDEDAVALRGVDRAVQAFTEDLPNAEADTLGEALLRMMDSAITGQRLRLATRMILGVRGARQARTRIGRWMEAVVSEVRLRPLVTAFSTAKSEQATELLDLFRALGPWGVSPLIRLLGNVASSQHRRRLSETLLEIGLDELAPLGELLASDQPLVAQEALFLLSRSGRDDALPLLLNAQRHPSPLVRAALLESCERLPRERAQDLAAELLRDEDIKVRVAAAQAIARLPGRSAEVMVEAMVQKPSLDHQPLELKRALLEAHALLGQERAVQSLQRYLRDGEGLFAPKDAEETAIAAAWALALVRAVPAVEILKRTAACRNRKVRETAKEALLFMRGNA